MSNLISPANEGSNSDAGDSRLELTVRAVVLGLVLSVVMGAANVYVGLKAGMTVSASIPAAVMAMLLFRLFFRRSSILEANQVQTCASAGESLAAGIIFTMPALIVIGHWQSFNYWVVTLVAFCGGILGVMFMIPMRKVFVVDNDELPYPEGVACAAVLEAGEQESVDESEQSAAGSLIAGGLLGFLVKFGGGFLGLFLGSLEAARVTGGRILYFGGDLSPMLVAVGFIVRLNVAVLIFLGGALGWLVGIPLYGGAEEMMAEATADGGSFDPVEGAYGIWSARVRYVGVGAMVIGGISSLISVRAGLMAAIRHLVDGLRSSTPKDETTGRDIPTALILALSLICAAILLAVNYRFTEDLGITLLATAVMMVMGFFFTAVASYIVGLVGNSNSPVSGMTITAVLVAGGILWACGYTGMDAMVATLGVAAIVCCVACTSGDVCNDLKTGSLVGAAPFRQQLMQIGGVAVASLVMAPVLTLLHNNTLGGIGGKELPAPQANLFANLARGFAGESELPWNMIAMGAGLGLLILVLDAVLRSRGSTFRAHLMPIAVGMYLPFGLAVPILIGGLIAHFYSRRAPQESHDRVLHRGVLFSSGVIAGEALTAVGLAGLVAVGISSVDFGLSGATVTILSVLVAPAIVAAFIYFCRPQRAT